MKQLFTWLGIFIFTVASSQTEVRFNQLIRNTVKLYDLDYTENEADSLLSAVANVPNSVYKGMHQSLPPNDLPYPFAFNPLPFGNTVPITAVEGQLELPSMQMPANKNELAFYSIPQLAIPDQE